MPKIQGQIEDSPTDTDSDDSWFNQPRRRYLEFEDNTDTNDITLVIGNTDHTGNTDHSWFNQPRRRYLEFDDNTDTNGVNTDHNNTDSDDNQPRRR